MGQYLRGDVVLTSVALDDRSSAKIRPAVVIATGDAGMIHVCPVSSRPPSDAPGIPISLDDFSEGGLDLFGESYVMTSRVLTLSSGKVMGKKGGSPMSRSRKLPEGSRLPCCQVWLH